MVKYNYGFIFYRIWNISYGVYKRIGGILMKEDLFDILYDTFGSTIDDIISYKTSTKIDTFSHSLKLSGCMMEFVDYLRQTPIDILQKKIKHKDKKLFIDYIKNLTFIQYDKLIVMCWWHDIGKIKIEKSILAKPGKLTNAEYEEMSKHSIYSADILRKIGFDPDIIVSVFFHHPKNFSEKKIYALLPAISLLEITDIYTALREPRIYREDSLSFDESIKLLKSELKKGLGNPFFDIFIDFVTEKEKENYDVFARFKKITLEEIVAKSMHYINKEKNSTELPKITVQTPL